MMAFSSALYNSLLEHVSSFQASQTHTKGTVGSTVVPTAEEDGVYYHFGGGALREMLHRRYKQICCSSNENLMSIKISILQAFNTKDKSDHRYKDKSEHQLVVNKYYYFVETYS